MIIFFCDNSMTLATFLLCIYNSINRLFSSVFLCIFCLDVFFSGHSQKRLKPFIHLTKKNYETRLERVMVTSSKKAQWRKWAPDEPIPGSMLAAHDPKVEIRVLVAGAFLHNCQPPPLLPPLRRLTRHASVPEGALESYAGKQELGGISDREERVREYGRRERRGWG